jgi:hypothetical protein
LVEELHNFHGVDHVVYTDFPAEGKISKPDARMLALKAVESVKGAPYGMDGISYLMQLEESGVVTPLMPQYRGEILDLTETDNLLQAVASLQGTRLEGEFEQRLSRAARFDRRLSSADKRKY